MKSKHILGIAFLMTLSVATPAQQKADNERMMRDIEVAKNVLHTLLKQQAKKEKGLFPIRVEGDYIAGQGATFKIPASKFNTFYMSDDGFNWSHDNIVHRGMGQEAKQQIKIAQQQEKIARQQEKIARQQVRMADSIDEKSKRIQKKIERKVEQSQNKINRTYKIAVKTNRANDNDVDDREVIEDDEHDNTDTQITMNGYMVNGFKKQNQDSLNEVFNTRLIHASTDFIADYGDILSQLLDHEKITITNRSEPNRFMENSKQKVVTVEAQMADVMRYKKGKISRDELVSKINVVSVEVSNNMQPDLELLQTIFARLYRSDLSKSYYCTHVRYEKMDGVGATFFMKTF